MVPRLDRALTAACLRPQRAEDGALPRGLGDGIATRSADDLEIGWPRVPGQPPPQMGTELVEGGRIGSGRHDARDEAAAAEPVVAEHDAHAGDATAVAEGRLNPRGVDGESAEVDELRRVARMTGVVGAWCLRGSGVERGDRLIRICRGGGADVKQLVEQRSDSRPVEDAGRDEGGRAVAVFERELEERAGVQTRAPGDRGGGPAVPPSASTPTVRRSSCLGIPRRARTWFGLPLEPTSSSTRCTTTPRRHPSPAIPRARRG